MQWIPTISIFFRCTIPLRNFVNYPFHQWLIYHPQRPSPTSPWYPTPSLLSNSNSNSKIQIQIQIWNCLLPLIMHFNQSPTPTFCCNFYAKICGLFAATKPALAAASYLLMRIPHNDNKLQFSPQSLALIYLNWPSTGASDPCLTHPDLQSVFLIIFSLLFVKLPTKPLLASLKWMAWSPPNFAPAMTALLPWLVQNLVVIKPFNFEKI